MAACLLVACVALSGALPARADDAGAAERARAEALLEAGRLYPAEQAARRATRTAPESAAAHHLLGRILLAREKWAEAATALQRAAALDPQRPGLQRQLGLARFELRDFAGAREALAAALEREPEDAALRLRLGLCELALGNPERAARAFERAARDPAQRQIALYNLGVAREQTGERDAAREAFERSVALDPPTFVGNRAWSHVQELERTEPGRPWQLALGAGLLYDSNVTREEIDRTSGEPDGAGQFELEASYTLPVGDLFELDAGYDFYQSLYFDSPGFDLQSHGFHATASRALGPVDASLGYTFSLNTLDADRFLDFHEARPSLGFTPASWWYASVAPALRVKRFAQDGDRDAEQGVLGLLQLFPIGSWDRYALVGLDLEIEDADADRFDYRGLTAQLLLELPFGVGEDEVGFDLRYRYRRRDYLDAGSGDFARRDDHVHSARARIEIPLARRVSMRAEYEFVDSRSDLRAADYTSNTVGAVLRFAL